MEKFHLNPDKGPMPCRANIATCPYGGEEVHYATRGEAQQAFEASLTAAHPFPAHSRPVNLQEELQSSIIETPNGISVDLVAEFASQSIVHHQLLDVAIEERAQAAEKWGLELEGVSPYGKPRSPNALDVDTFRGLKSKYDSYRDQTAALVEAYCESTHYAAKTLVHPPERRVGVAVATTSYSPNTPEWLQERYDSVGGSDVGVLAVMDFTPKEDLMYWDHRSMNELIESKTKYPEATDVARQNWASRGSRRGPRYRGTVWEARNRDRFADANPDLTVASCDGQYRHPAREWQRVNFDGLVGPRGGEAKGILELKTGADSSAWADGPPLAYRAQVLYYLDASELDYALVSVSIHDGPLRTFRLDRGDSVAPGRYDKPMSDYRTERVEPWFNELRASRDS